MAARPGPRQSRPRSEAHYGPERGTTYLLHFERPYKHAEHYRGWTSRPIAERLAEHLRGEGSVLTRAVVQAGIGIALARTWPNTTKDREDSLKHQGGARRCCPQCGIKPAASRLASDRLPEQAPERLSLYELDRLGTTSDGEPLPIVTTYPSRGAIATAAPREENDMFGRKAATSRPEAAGQPPNHAQQIAAERAGRLLHGELADPQGYLGDRRRSLSEVARSYLSRIDSARREKGLPELTGAEQDDIIGRAERGGFIDGADQFPEAGDMPDWLPRDGHIDELAQQRGAAVTQRGGPDHLAEMADDEREEDDHARQAAEIEAAEAAERDSEELQEWRPQGEAVIAAVDRWSDARVQAGQAEQQLRDAERAEQAALQAHDPDAADIARADCYAARERLAAARDEVGQRDREYRLAEEEEASRVDAPGADPGRDAARWTPYPELEAEAGDSAPVLGLRPDGTYADAIDSEPAGYPADAQHTEPPYAAEPDIEPERGSETPYPPGTAAADYDASMPGSPEHREAYMRMFAEAEGAGFPHTDPDTSYEIDNLGAADRYRNGSEPDDGPEPGTNEWYWERGYTNEPDWSTDPAVDPRAGTRFYNDGRVVGHDGVVINEADPEDGRRAQVAAEIGDAEENAQPHRWGIGQAAEEEAGQEPETDHYRATREKERSADEAMDRQAADYYRSPVGSDEHRAAYETMRERDAGIGYGGYEVDNAYELAAERYYEEAAEADFIAQNGDPDAEWTGDPGPDHLYGAYECTEPDPEGDHFGHSPSEPRDAGQLPPTYDADPFRLSGPASPEPYANYPQAELEAGA